MKTIISYRVRKVTRYLVTRHEQKLADNGCGEVGSSTERGEYFNAEVAYQVACALCKAEHDAAGTPPGDEVFQYPRHPDEETCTQRRAVTCGQYRTRS